MGRGCRSATTSFARQRAVWRRATSSRGNRSGLRGSAAPIRRDSVHRSPQATRRVASRLFHSACLGCHAIAGNPAAMGVTAPTDSFGSRSTIAPDGPEYGPICLWIKNAREMKPDVLMPTLGSTNTIPF